MAQRTKKWVLSVCITIFTLLAVFCMIYVIGDSGAFAQEESVTATGRRTITQTSTVNATDLHFVVYQADVNSAYILDWGIKLSVPFSNMTAVPGSWPFNDGKTHSVAIDIYGIDVPPGAKVNIEAILNLNEYNTVKFHDIHWTYGTQGPVKPIDADIGWAVATNPGSSSGGWLISKYTATDLKNNQIVDLVGHEFLPTHVSPALQDMSISNGTPDNPGTSPVTITNWSVAIVPTLPSWDEINNWQGWYSTYPGPIILYPGQTVQFPTPTPTRRVTITPTPTRRATPTPTPTPTRRTTPTPTWRITPTPTWRITPTPTWRITPTPTWRTVTPPPTFRGVTNTPTPTPGQSGFYIIIYEIQYDWGTGATVSVTIINNTTTAVNGWTLEFTFPGNQTITNLWNGTFTQSGAAVSVRDNGFNATIGANGGSVNFGFNMNYSGTNPEPTSFTLNGTACAVQ